MSQDGNQDDSKEKRSEDSNPKDLSDSNDNAGENEEHEVKFMADGPVYVDVDGQVKSLAMVCHLFVCFSSSSFFTVLLLFL